MKDMNTKELKEAIAEINPDAILFDDIDEAIIGMGQQWASKTIVVYDREKCIEILADKFKKDNDTIEEAYSEAIEYFEFNIECAYVGEHTPFFFTPLEELL